jgi:hypothetical protein
MELQHRTIERRRAVDQGAGRSAAERRPEPGRLRREHPAPRGVWFLATALCLLAAGCTSDARMGALKADMASRQAAAEVAASRPGATAEDKERARGYASAQSCIDKIQAHGKAAQAQHMAMTGAMAAVSVAGPAGAMAARAMGPVQGAAMRSQTAYSVACY